MDLLKKIENLSIEKGNLCAIRYKDMQSSYLELWKKVKELSKCISDLIGPENVNQPIAIIGERSVEFVISMIAVMHSRNYYIPIEMPTPEARVKYIKKNVAGVIEIKNHQYLLEKKGILLESGDRLAYAMYTSGTTGKPKGVKIKYENLNNLVNELGTVLYGKYLLPKNVGVIASFSFDASVKQIFGALYYGNTLVISENSDRYFSRKMAGFFKKNSIAVADLTPSHLKILINSKQNIEVECLLVGGESLQWKTVDEFMEVCNNQVEIINVYGPTECCVDVCYYKVPIEKRAREDETVPIGKPLKNIGLTIVDKNNNLVSEPNIEGELVISGKQVGAGYYDKKETNKVFKRNHKGEMAYYSGDIVKYNGEFDLVFLRREDRQIKLRGNRIELDEIEKNIIAISQVKDATVIFDDENEKIVAFVKVINQAGADTYIKRKLKEKMPSYMVPQKIILVNSIPLTSNGKKDLKKLKRYYQ